jgi:uncharacterized UPF0146 family protein
MLIIDTTREAKRLEAGVGVFGDVAPDVVFQPLGDVTSVDINHQSGLPKWSLMIR